MLRDIIAEHKLTPRQAQSMRVGLRWANHFGLIDAHRPWGRYAFAKEDTRAQLALSIILEVVKNEGSDNGR